jgi:hypothetical protein
MNITPPQSIDASGYCRTCGTTHRLPADNARTEAGRLLARLEEERSINLFGKGDRRAAEWSTDPLFGDQRGKMFGVLQCIGSGRRQIWLYAFSGQFNGRWTAPGWVPPLFDVQGFGTLNGPAESEIKRLGREIEQLPKGESKRQKELERRELSRKLMQRIHDLYRLNNFSSERRHLTEIFNSAANLPAGTGDCCAPKLLNFAALQGYRPVSIAEFYFGRSNRSGTRSHGQFYAPCSSKCGPLLGFLLCGIDGT